MDVMSRTFGMPDRLDRSLLFECPAADRWQAWSSLLHQASQPYQILDFSLGATLLSRSSPRDQLPASVHSLGGSPNSLYWIVRGRVRLLCTAGEPTKSVTALLLEEGDTFGAETGLSFPTLNYDAIAATDGQIACIPAESLAALDLPADWQAWLLAQSQARERMIFLRSCTAERSLPSRVLRSLLPYWKTLQIPAGVALAEVIGTDRYWLRQGQIGKIMQEQAGSNDQPEAPSQRVDGGNAAVAADLPCVGASWGYPDPVPPDWIAQTDLIIYQLPAEQWTRLNLLRSARHLAVHAQAHSPARASSSPIAERASLVSGTAANGAAANGSAANRAAAETPVSGVTSSNPASSNPAINNPSINNPAIENSAINRSVGSGMVSSGMMSSGMVNSGTGQHSLPNPPAAANRSVIPASRSQSPQVVFPKPIRRRVLDWFDRYPWIEQQSSSDCGAACLVMIARYWGKRLPLYQVREQSNVGRSGASLKSLARAAEEIGFHARPVRASLSRLVDQPHPWIAHWQGNHYLVVYRIRGNRVLLADPAQGRRSISRQEFLTHWSGYALLLDPAEHLQSTVVKSASLGRYLNALIPYMGLSVQIILISILIQLFSLVTPLLTQIILDQVVVQKSQTTLNAFAIGLVLFGMWGICMGSVRQYLLSYFSNRLDLTLLSGFIRYTLTLPLKFFESRRVGDILTRVQENQKIQRFLIGQVLLAWLDFVTGFIYLGLMLYYNWRLTLLVLLLIPPIVILTLISTPFLRQVSRQIFHEAADQNSSLVELISGIATVKAAAAERELRWRWEDQLTSQMNAVFRGQKLGIGLQFTSGLINALGGAALLWYGATLVIQDQLTIGQFVAFNMMMGYVISPVITLVNLWDELQEVFISIERLNDVFETQPEEPPQQSRLVLPTLQGLIQFEDVTFRYSEDEDCNTLQNLSFAVQPGQTIAIVGRSGSGKTTLVKLIQGLHFPSRGRICIDGHDIRHVSLNSLRSQIGVVPQECFLFSGTIFENITLYRPDYSLEQVIQVAKLAEAHAFIQSLPLGYSTMVGERGATLSGGQRQRIAIARALLGEPRILILDEATSSLDTESERRFQRNLAQISRERTTVMIAHRLSTVRNADRILVLDRGILVEQGTHDALMALQGLYSHLAQQQLNL